MTPKFIQKLIKQYKNPHTVIEIIKKNPYKLSFDVDGIGFKTADELALKTGGTLDNPERLKAGIIYSIKQACFSSGSTFVYEEELKKEFYKIIFK